ncbi:MAG TPA: hypothetical protein VFB58_10890 [Chloroflexota bacterium]|nr:hypothetical protein [Chloroflexota bacterium]
MTNREIDGDAPSPASIPDKETSSAYQDGSSSDIAGEEGPGDMGSTDEGPGLTAGGTGTEINVEPDITEGGYAGDYGGHGDTTGGESNGSLWSGTGIPPKPRGER